MILSRCFNKTATVALRRRERAGEREPHYHIAKKKAKTTATTECKKSENKTISWPLTTYINNNVRNGYIVLINKCRSVARARKRKHTHTDTHTNTYTERKNNNNPDSGSGEHVAQNKYIKINKKKNKVIAA